MPQFLTGRFQGGAPAQAWSDGGNISVELAPQTGTITRMHLLVRADVTTTDATNYSDYWDRVIRSLTLARGSKTLFDFSDLRTPYHFMRYHAPHLAARRPAAVENNRVNSKQQFGLTLHFGVAPWKVNPATMALEDNPFDLTAGIPPSQNSQLTLTGNFAAADALGSGVTLNAADLYLYFEMVQGLPSEPKELWLPRAIPVWSMESPTISGTSTSFSTSHSIPGGAWLRRIFATVANGATAPRDDGVFNSLRLQNNRENRTIIAWGGEAGAADDWQVHELVAQTPFNNLRPPTDGGTPGVPAIGANREAGIIDLPVWLYGRPERNADPAYGLNLINMNTGDLRLEYGVADAVGVGFHVLYQRYEMLDWGHFDG